MCDREIDRRFTSVYSYFVVLRLLLINGPRVRKQINCASMQKILPNAQGKKY